MKKNTFGGGVFNEILSSIVTSYFSIEKIIYAYKQRRQFIHVRVRRREKVCVSE